jgi:hypothetical protein
MTLIQPLAVSTNGTVGVKFVTTFADYRAPKLTECNAGSSIELSCYLTGDGLTTNINENNIEDPRLCSKQIFESPGDYVQSLELAYVYNPGSPSNDVARIGLPQGAKGFVVLRWAIDAEQAWAIGDLVDVYPVTMGKPRKQTPARNGVHKIMQKPFVVGAVKEDVALVA